MTHDTRPSFVEPSGNIPRGKSPQRVIQRPRIPDPTWSRALTKAKGLNQPIGHVLTELLEEWLNRGEPNGR